MSVYVCEKERERERDAWLCSIVANFKTVIRDEGESDDSSSSSSLWSIMSTIELPFFSAKLSIQSFSHLLLFIMKEAGVDLSGQSIAEKHSR